jgi:spermidine synthase
MSLLWEKRAGGVHYQVRRAGRSLRLYTNGVLHSQYNPRRPVTGSVWDLLWLPAFFYPPDKLRNILVLGVGGGAVIRHLREFVEPEKIVGVELSKTHLSIARRFFDIKGDDIELHQADALDWVKRYSGPPFDMIVDDLFADYDGEPQRAVSADTAWVNALSRLLGNEGLIVSNFATRLELDVSAYMLSRQCQKRFASAFALSTAQNYNAVGVFTRRHVTTQQLRARIKAIPLLDPRKSGGACYGIRTLY